MSWLGFSLAAIFLTKWLIARNDVKHLRAALDSAHKGEADFLRDCRVSQDLINHDRKIQ